MVWDVYNSPKFIKTLEESTSKINVEEKREQKNFL